MLSITPCVWFDGRAMQAHLGLPALMRSVQQGGSGSTV